MYIVICFDEMVSSLVNENITSHLILWNTSFVDIQF